jgi:hypothetical protein
MKTQLLFYCCCFLCTFTFSQHELWGTVSNGGQFGHGFIFKSDSIGQNLVIVHHFDSLDGSNPGALLAGADNKLYGLTAAGGINGDDLYSGGVLYEYDLTTSLFRVIQHFGPANTEITGIRPSGDGYIGLMQMPSGLVYGQISGQYQTGVIFTFNPVTDAIATALSIPTFQGGNTNQTLGNRIVGPLYLHTDGFLYGTTHTNSQCPVPSPNLGSIIRINPGTNAFSIRHLSPCNTVNGYRFDSQFTTYNDELYSVTKVGGANNFGVIYAFNTTTNAYVNKYDFEGGLLGYQPSTMVKAANGKFYGTAYGGLPEPNLATGGGILFEFNPGADPGDQFTKKIDFLYGNGSSADVGPYPFSLIDGTNGNLYGVTPYGIFEYNITLNETHPSGRFPLGLSLDLPATPSLTAVCRKPSYAVANDTALVACTGSDVSFDLQSDNTLTYVWRKGGIPDASQTSGVLTFSGISSDDEGTWIAEMTNVCGTTTGPSVTIAVNETNVPTVSQNGPLLSSTAATNYQWIDCTNGNTAINGATSQVFAPAANGTYAVVTTSGDCQDTSACFVLDDLGLDNQQQLLISLYPNPASDEVQVLTDGSVIVHSVSVLSTTGQIVVKGTSTTLDVASLEAGTYFIVAETTSGNWYGKFVKTAR